MKLTTDTLKSQIPSYILENYPKFFEFIEAYYEWLNQEENPYSRIKNHMSYLDFQKSLDEYVEFMKKEYLTGIPEDVLLDKELFIKFSKNFNLARGSRYSYKFLFSVLFDENDTEFYLPKDNILRTSDGTWITDQSKLIVTNSNGNVKGFNFSRITQEKEVFPGIFEYARADVENARNLYSGRYNLIELTVTNIEGTFDKEFQIESESGNKEWLVDSISSFDISNAGTNYKAGTRIDLASAPYTITRDADESGSFDTRVTTQFKKEEIISYTINGSSTTTYDYDGRTITDSDISAGDTIQIQIPSFPGYIIIDEVSTNDRSIIEFSILEVPIGISEDRSIAIDSVGGSSFSGTVISGLVSPVLGYYDTNRGHLSSNMYLQDGFYYQEYSYVIKTFQDLDSYNTVVQEALHPAGFQMFGNIKIINLIEILIALKSEIQNFLNYQIEEQPIYSLGANYSFFDRLKGGLSERLYKLYHFDDKPELNYNTYVNENIFRFDNDMAQGVESIYMVDGIILNVDDYVLSNKYDLFDDTRKRNFTFDDQGYVLQDLSSEYFSLKQPFDLDDIKGWLTKHYLQDYYLYIPQEYTEETDGGVQYFETGYAGPQ
jgi:hypothetical protein